jgi:Na+/melibiose symporter-like transporter
MEQQENQKSEINRAKYWQLLLFAFNNGATNVYFILTATYIAYYANGVLGLALIFATSMVTVMRIFDGLTDPIIGMLIDKTSGKYGKFRPYMLLGNVIMAASAILMYFGTRLIPSELSILKYVVFTILYMLYVIGYTFQTACTKSGQTCITNDPEQRPMFTVFNTIASMAGMGLIQIIAVVVGGKYGYGSTNFFNIIVPLAILLSFLLTIFAIIGIWQKDAKEFYGIDDQQGKVSLKHYKDILYNNKELRMLIVAGAGTKLAFSVATNTAVACMLYASMMNDYNGLYLPLYGIGYVASVPFFILVVRTAQKLGQKASLVRFTFIALIFYTGVLALLLMWQPENTSTTLSLSSFNIFTLLFLIFYAIGYGSYYSTADMVIPMVADCSDYEIYRSGKYIPGVIGTLFSLVDKLVSSLGSTIIGFAVLMLGLNTLPDTNTPYIGGMKWIVILLFCVVPMIAWIATLIAMKHYSLTGDRMKEIQKVNAKRKEAINNGMRIEDAMAKWQSSYQIDNETNC